MLVLTCLASATNVSASAAWSVVPSPNPTVPTGSFGAVSCPSKSLCVSVGSYPGGTGYSTPFAEIRSSGAWSMLSMPSPSGSTGSFLNAVSCVSTTYCVAAGYSRNSDGTQSPLLEAWNSRTWSIQPAPQAAGAGFTQLWGVSCAAVNMCMAVGDFSSSSPNSDFNAFAELWNGSTWSVTAAGPASTQLMAVDCSDSNHCLAVGNFVSSSTVAMQWNGSAWIGLATPTLSGVAELSGVSCVGARSCVAVGFQNSGSATGGVPLTLVEQWNGSKWRVVPTPNPPGTIGAFLDSVACDLDGCTAAGYNEPPSGSAPILTLIESWNGSIWSLRSTPNPANALNALFQGISCASQSSCVAAGYYAPFGDGPAGSPNFTLAEALTAGQWSIQSTPNPSGSLGAGLNGVSCPTATRCEAVGFTADQLGNYVPAAEVWDGAAWTGQTVPGITIATTSATLQAVSCSMPTACVAVGNYFDSNGNSQIFAEYWDGSSWSLTSLSSPSGSVSAQLNALSCPLTSLCMAIGVYSTTGFDEVPLDEVWNGSGFSIQAMAVPSGSLTAIVNSVSCSSPTACVAVGVNTDRSSTGPLAETWDGSTWTIQPAASPLGFNATFTGVSCPAGITCEAVGYFNPGTGYFEPFAEGWDGTTWTVQNMPTPNQSLPAQPNAISCTAASSCRAVGYASDSNLKNYTLVEAWDGVSWALVPSASSPGPTGSQLNDVSCVGACQAVGQGNGVTLVVSGD